ncbi:phage tail tape measure protein [Shouchella rhizosphaerae]|uniref:phage tail tape measure protein n=1 Tax=Shouchella rhizosphaerae TaxID=866786 RepID=UPI003F7DDA38
MFGTFGSASDATVLRVGWDASAVDSGVSNLNSRLSAARSEMRATGAQMGGFGRSTEGLRKKQDGLNKIYELQGQKVKDLEANYQRLVQEKGSDSKATIDASRHYNNALAEYAKMESQLQDLTKEIAFQESAWGRMESGLTGFSQSTGRLADGFGNAGRKMTMGLTLPIVGIGTAVLKTGMDFEKSMSKVQALSGASAEEMAKMEAQAKELGESTVFSASQAAEAQAFLAMAGWEVADIYDAMPGLLNLAAAGQMELGRTADITSNIMQAFAINANEAGRVSDVLAEAASNSNTDIEMLGEAMEYAAPTANVFGWSLEETTAALMSFGDAGIQGGKAGQAWSTSLQRLSKPTRQMRNLMEELNIQMFDSEGVMKPLPELVGEIEKATKGMTDEQQASVITTLFGNQAFKHWAILLEEGSEELAKTTEQLENSEGAAQNMADTMLDNAYGSFVELKSAAEGLAIQFSEHMIPHFITITDKATELVRWFGSLDKDTQKYILTAAGIAAVLGPAAIVLSTTLRSVSYLSGGLAKAVGAFGRYTTSAKVAQSQTSKFGASAQLAGTQVIAGTKNVGRFGGALGKIGGIASLAGLGMLAFGDDSQQGLGTALLFAPEIGKLGKGIFDLGSKAVKGGGKLIGFGKNASTASKGIGTLARGVGTFGSRAAALGGPIGIGVAAITGLGIAGYEVYEHYKDKVMPTFDSFGDIVMDNGEKISESTAEQLDAFKTLADEAMVEINKLSWGAQEVTDEMAESLTGKFSEMGTMIKDELNKNYSQSQQDLEKFLGQSEAITEEHQVEIQKRYEDYYNARISHTEEMEGRINSIVQTAADENRSITDEERVEINRIKDSMMEANVRAVAQGSEEQQAIMTHLKHFSSEMNAEQAADTIKKSLEAKDGAIKAADERATEVINWANKQVEETGLLSREEADQIIAEAKRRRDEEITAAEDAHIGVVTEAEKQAGAHIEQVDMETGEIITMWGHFTNDLRDAVNWVTDKINIVLDFFGISKIPKWVGSSPVSRTKSTDRITDGETQFATGTSPLGHKEDGWATISERGPELVHDPKVGTYVSNNKGPEQVYLHKGSSVLPAHHTKSLLNRYGFGNKSGFMLPAYEKGVGEDDLNWWDSLLQGPKALFDKVVGAFQPDWISNKKGMYMDIAKGTFGKIKEGAIKFFTDLIPTFDFGGGGGFPNFPQPPFVMTSGFGPRKSPGGIGSSNHKGLDFAAPIGTSIPSQSTGKVSFAGWLGGYGNLVKISTGIYDLLYGHNSKNTVKRGQNVSVGQTIGLVGSTGNSTGPHVHFEVRKNGTAVNPKTVAGELSGGIGGVSVGGNVTKWIAAAMKIAGVSGKDWLNGLSLIAQKESGGNPRAINDWDINARRGIPSKGLMQTIGPTFNAFKLPGMGDIYNPVHNAVASIRYIQSRYGGINNVPGIKSMRAGGRYVGYADGGYSNKRHLAWVSERDHGEYHIPEEPSERSLSLFAELGEKLGVFNTVPSVDSIEPGDTRTYRGGINLNFDALTSRLDTLIQSVKNSDFAPVILVKLGEETIYRNVGRNLGARADVDALWEV